MRVIKSKAGSEASKQGWPCCLCATAATASFVSSTHTLTCPSHTHTFAGAFAEAQSLVDLLSARHGDLCAVLEAPGGGYPDLRNSVWQAPASAQAAAQSLGPQMAENRKKVRACEGRVEGGVWVCGGGGVWGLLRGWGGAGVLAGVADGGEHCSCSRQEGGGPLLLLQAGCDCSRVLVVRALSSGASPHRVSPPTLHCCSLTPNQPTRLWPQVEELLREALVLATCLKRATASSASMPAGLLEKLLPKRAKQYQKGISGAPAAVAEAPK